MQARVPQTSPCPGMASRGLASLRLTICDTFNKGLISLTQFPCL